MKITDNFTASMIGAASQGEKRKKEVKGKEEAKGASHVAVNISGKGQEIARARALALAAPEVRQELVDEIVELIGRGEYNITGGQVADRMIEEHMALWT